MQKTLSQYLFLTILLISTNTLSHGSIIQSLDKTNKGEQLKELNTPIVIIGTVGGTLHGLNERNGDHLWSINLGKSLFSSSVPQQTIDVEQKSQPIFIPSLGKKHMCNK
jgi:hypothetical protein